MASAPELNLETSGRFDVLRRLGEGGMGVVYEAYDRERRMRVAIKTLRTLSAEAILRFKNEFRALQDLQHPNLCALGELISVGGQWFFSMELVDGVDLLGWVRPAREGLPAQPHTTEFVDPSPSADTLRPRSSAVATRVERPTRPPVDVTRLRAALVDLARGVSALHAAGVVHRDIKPSNIMVDKHGRVVLLDFGLATTAARPGDSDIRIVGTADYMAPEQASGRKVGPEADWYSVGVVLYEALTGAVPFSGAPLEVLLQKQGRDPVPPRALAPETPADLDALCAGLLRKDPRERFGAKEIYTRLHRADAAEPSTGPREVQFVGRKNELSALEAAYERTRAGAPVTLHVRGESGVGKSALVRHFVDKLRASAPGVVVLQGRCFERESVPYKACDGVVDSLARWLAKLNKVEAASMLPARAGLLADVFPVLRRVEAVAQAPRPSPDVDPLHRRRQLFAALRELFARVAQKRPLVIVIDDLQWADLDSLALLDAITRPPEAPAMLLLATMRSGNDAPAQRSLFMAAEAREVHLSRLPHDDARLLASELLEATEAGGAPLTMSADAIAEEAGGHPLFMDELVRHALAARDGKSNAPLHLEDALWDRVRRLGADAQRLLELVAVAGGPLVQQAAARAAEIEFAVFSQHAASLRAANLVRTTGTRPSDFIEPYHDRVRATMQAHRTGAELRRAHERIAIGLESTGRGDPEALAMHWQGAGEVDKAAAYAGQAAERATKALAFDRAAQLYRQTLVLRPPGAPDVPTLQVRLGDALAQTGRGREAAHAFLSAAERSAPAEALELRRRASEQLLRSGHVDEGMLAMAPVLRAVKLRLPKTARGAVMSMLWRRMVLRVRGLKFTRRQASELPPSLLARVDAAWSAAVGLGNIDTIRGADFAARHLHLALAAGEPARVARALAFEACLNAAMGPRTIARANALADAARLLADEVNDPHAMALSVAARAIALHMDGHWRACLPFFDEAERILRERCTGVNWELATGNLLRAYSLARLGELTELSKNVTASLQEAEQRGDLYGSTLLRMGEPNLIWLAQDLPDEARTECEDAIGRWSQKGFHQQHMDFHFAMVQIALYVGDGKAGFQRIDELWPKMQASYMLELDVPRIVYWDLRARAAVAAAAQTTGAERAAMVKQAKRALRRLGREPAAWAQASAIMQRAALAHLAGDDDAAVRLLGSAAGQFDAVDMRMHGAIARGRRGALVGGDAGRADREALSSFSRAQNVAAPERFARVIAPGY
ncbi:MAG: Serine/threonine-protein kinase PknA [Myxococcales bacterium]|nr:Serine/threonine-protein kinase PknA [Myxococcales bacterium]